MRSTLSPKAERVPHLLLDTGVLTRLAPNGAPKGRNNEAQANGLGPRTPSRQPASPERARYRSEPRRAVVKLETAALITPFQGFRIGDRRTRGPRPLAWASLFRPFGAESTHPPCPAEDVGKDQPPRGRGLGLLEIERFPDVETPGKGAAFPHSKRGAAGRPLKPLAFLSRG